MPLRNDSHSRLHQPFEHRHQDFAPHFTLDYCQRGTLPLVIICSGQCVAHGNEGRTSTCHSATIRSRTIPSPSHSSEGLIHLEYEAAIVLATVFVLNRNMTTQGFHQLRLSIN